MDRLEELESNIINLMDEIQYETDEIMNHLDHFDLPSEHTAIAMATELKQAVLILTKYRKKLKG